MEPTTVIDHLGITHSDVCSSKQFVLPRSLAAFLLVTTKCANPRGASCMSTETVLHDAGYLCLSLPPTINHEGEECGEGGPTLHKGFMFSSSAVLNNTGQSPSKVPPPAAAESHTIVFAAPSAGGTESSIPTSSSLKTKLLGLLPPHRISVVKVQRSQASDGRAVDAVSECLKRAILSHDVTDLPNPKGGRFATLAGDKATYLVPNDSHHKGGSSTLSGFKLSVCQEYSCQQGGGTVVKVTAIPMHRNVAHLQLPPFHQPDYQRAYLAEGKMVALDDEHEASQVFRPVLRQGTMGGGSSRLLAPSATSLFPEPVLAQVVPSLEQVVVLGIGRGWPSNKTHVLSDPPTMEKGTLKFQHEKEDSTGSSTVAATSAADYYAFLRDQFPEAGALLANPNELSSAGGGSTTGVPWVMLAYPCANWDPDGFVDMSDEALGVDPITSAGTAAAPTRVLSGVDTKYLRPASTLWSSTVSFQGWASINPRHHVAVNSVLAYLLSTLVPSLKVATDVGDGEVPRVTLLSPYKPLSTAEDLSLPPTGASGGSLFFSTGRSLAHQFAFPPLPVAAESEEEHADEATKDSIPEVTSVREVVASSLAPFSTFDGKENQQPKAKPKVTTQKKGVKNGKAKDADAKPPVKVDALPSVPAAPKTKPAKKEKMAPAAKAAKPTKLRGEKRSRDADARK